MSGPRSPSKNSPQRSSAASWQRVSALSRPFNAHLTLGRIRKKHFSLVTGEVTTSGESCPVNEAVLFKSELQSSGAHYTPIERAPLGGEPSPLLTETDQSIYNPKAGG